MSINDELIWQSLNGNFCSFKSTVSKTHNFCRNEQNVTGLCNKSACPLANSRYATIREIEGRCYLMIKTIERAHMPKKLWQKIKLPRNYAKALAVDLELAEMEAEYEDEEEEERLVEYIEAAEDFESDMEDRRTSPRASRTARRSTTPPLRGQNGQRRAARRRHPRDDEEEEKPAMATAMAF
ncbi:hypothetical protein JL722_1225 [Aureococcus anophagefferens]|nr:hypothetical protein JL722_1225 [Aureococcus anophagefferens]